MRSAALLVANCWGVIVATVTRCFCDSLQPITVADALTATPELLATSS